MISTALGKRYERLLFLTAPISIAAMIACLVAIASSTRKERVEAHCYTEAVSVFAKKTADLAEQRSKYPNEEDVQYIYYKLALQKIWIDGSDMDSCYQVIDHDIDTAYKLSPSDMVADWKSRANKLLQTPLSVYGVLLPKDATIDLYAAKITVSLDTITRSLQVILLPIMLLWLGSLYSTRYRECLTTNRATSLSDVFPHIINMYPAFDQPSPKKRNVFAPYAKSVACFLYAAVRIGLLSIFILPPVTAYLYSLYLVSTERSAIIYGLAGFVVFIFSFTTIIAEILPMHYNKVFPDPRFDRSSN
jgi:hypothetical protein